MKSSNIGGQAVLEGIMMRRIGKHIPLPSGEPDGEIEVDIPGLQREFSHGRHHERFLSFEGILILWILLCLE